MFEKEKQKIIKQIRNFVNNTEYNQFVEPRRTALEAERIKREGYRYNDIIARKRDDQVNITFELRNPETINKFLDMIENEKFYVINYGFEGFYNEYESEINLIVRD